MRKYIFAASAALLGLAPLAASAQDVPSYAQGSQAGGDEQIRGRVTAFDGAYSVQVSDDRGFTDDVQLHQGTIINPTGITIAPGMIVSILGYNGGNVFEANEVDTPYTFYGGEPYYGGHPWNYYGPSIGLDFFFGNVGWWHGGDFNGGYRYDRGARVYANVNVGRIYNNYNGRFNGRNYVAPAARGGYVAGRSYNQTHAVNNVTRNVNRTTNVYAPRTTNVTNGGTHVYTRNTGVTHTYNAGTTHTYNAGTTHTYNAGATHTYNAGVTRNYTPTTTHVYNGTARPGTVHTQVIRSAGNAGGGRPGGFGGGHAGGGHAGGAGGGHVGGAGAGAGAGGGHAGGGGNHR